MAKRLRAAPSVAASAGAAAGLWPTRSVFGWRCADASGIKSAVGLDGGDVAQAAWRLPTGGYEVLAPRIALPAAQSSTLRLQTDAKFATPNVRALRGGALSYFTIRQTP